MRFAFSQKDGLKTVIERTEMKGEKGWLISSSPGRMSKLLTVATDDSEMNEKLLKHKDKRKEHRRKKNMKKKRFHKKRNQ